MFISSTDRVTRVVGMLDKEGERKTKGVFIDGKGYLDENGIVWIYSGSGRPSNANEYPFFWLNGNSELVFSNPNPLILKKYCEDSMTELTEEVINANTNEGDQYYTEQAIQDMNASTAVYRPIEHKKDDSWKKVVKRAILLKSIDIARLKYKTGQKYQLPNMKAALSGETKMSNNYFMAWAELLGYDYEIRLIDNGTDTQDPLPDVIVYRSWTDDVLTLSEIKELENYIKNNTQV